ncbi:MAG: Phosphate acyltransferase [candidate division BRC1 bacterium ADurb.Bin183]|nr:MAG: Phosphate acyltransferase [candidate division BRC1 bacterium ADurb.Bin183]
MRIAIDAAGGDYGPRGAVEGAMEAAKRFDYELLLVGDPRYINHLMKARRFSSPKITVVPASEKVKMGEHAKDSLKKKDSSMAVATRLVKEGKADAFVSAGNTGAAMASALFTWRPLPGVSRPAISAILPTLKHSVVLIDAGANVDCKPVNLLQFAVMGHCYAKYILGRAKPRIGLLSIGEEEIKGNELTLATYGLLQKTSLNFRGNAEGRDIVSDKFDVIVCDGFIGNIVLKFGEGIATMILRSIKGEISKNIISRFAAIGVKPAFKNFRKRVDYAEYGGAPLLGLNGACIICHGKSDPRAMMNAIRLAGEIVNINLNKHIIQEMELLEKIDLKI